MTAETRGRMIEIAEVISFSYLMALVILGMTSAGLIPATTELLEWKEAVLYGLGLLTYVAALVLLFITAMGGVRLIWSLMGFVLLFAPPVVYLGFYECGAVSFVSC